MYASNTNLEQLVLSFFFNYNNAYDEVSGILRPMHFFIETHQIIYDEICNMFNKGSRVDILTICHSLQAHKIDPSYISDITQLHPPYTALTTYVEMLIELSNRRKLQNIVDTLDNQLKTNVATPECWHTLEKQINHYVNFNTKVLGFDTLCADIIQDMEHLLSNPSDLLGITTGFMQLNNITGGFKAGELIILAGRPSVGKTAMALNMALACAKNKAHGGPVLFISLEMTPSQIGKRIIAMQLGIPLLHFTHGSIDAATFTQMKRGMPTISKLPFFTYDSFVVTIPKLRSLLRQYKRTHNIQFVVVDYLQLITGNDRSNSREQEVSEISRSLKLLAKEVNIPILSLSQMSRDIEKRQTASAPKLSDLRNSGAIEQDADIIIFLHRHTVNDVEDRGKIVCTVAKNRNGPLGEMLLSYDGTVTKFEEFDHNTH
jgi:replicative DNA helicase